MYLRSVNRGDVVYRDERYPSNAAVFWSDYRYRHIGYIGDVNAEVETTEVTSPMCGVWH